MRENRVNAIVLESGTSMFYFTGTRGATVNAPARRVKRWSAPEHLPPSPHGSDAAARKVTTDAGFGPESKVPAVPDRTGLQPGMCFSDQLMIANYGSIDHHFV